MGKPPTVTSVVCGGMRRRLNYSYDDGSQMIEEYDMRTHELLVRLTKKPKDIGEAPWVYEVGEQPPKSNEETLMKSSNNNVRGSLAQPIFLRKDELSAFQWRIRNLPYPADTYMVDIDADKQEIVVRTTNKKYYKRFDVADLRRAGLKLQKELLSWEHKNNCLVVTVGGC